MNIKNVQNEEFAIPEASGHTVATGLKRVKCISHQFGKQRRGELQTRKMQRPLQTDIKGWNQ
jgi:hypothetical protein